MTVRKEPLSGSTVMKGLKGFAYKLFLSNQYGMDISLRQLHRLLHQQNLYRSYHKDTVNVVLEAIKADIDGPSQILSIAVFIKSLYIMVSLRQMEKWAMFENYIPRRC